MKDKQMKKRSKAKHIPFKDFLVQVKKRGKKRGRPSRVEIFMSWEASDWLKKNAKDINRAMDDLFVYGTGVLQISDIKPKKGRS